MEAVTQFKVHLRQETKKASGPMMNMPFKAIMMYSLSPQEKIQNMIETQNEFGVIAAQNERSSNLRGSPNLRK